MVNTITDNNLSREEMAKLLDEVHVENYTIYKNTVKISKPRSVLIYGNGSNVILVNQKFTMEMPLVKALDMLRA